MSISISYFLSLFFLTLSIHHLLCYSLDFDSIYQFGDSLSDTGNLATQDPNNACAKLPYGQQQTKLFPKPTGRCSDGLLMLDFFAKALNLPFLNPYLDEGSEFGHGVNFAVAGGTAMSFGELSKWNITPSTKTSLDIQLQWFKTHLNSYCHSSNNHNLDECRQKRLSKALILMGEIGGNDYNYPLMDTNISTHHLYNLVPHVIQTIKDGVQEVIDVGAKQVVVPGNFPIGCMPAYLQLKVSNDSSMYDQLKCLKELNELAVLHNNHLQISLDELRSTNPGVSIFYGDYYCAFTWLLQNAASLGFEEEGVFKACCGKGDNEYNCNSNDRCGDEGVPVCENPAKRLSWDGLHLTQQAYKHLAEWLLSNMFTSSSPSSCGLSLQGYTHISVLPNGYTTTY